MSSRFGFVGTYPPTQCGLATFTVALRDALVGSDLAAGPVVRLVEAREVEKRPEVLAQLVQGDPGSLGRATTLLNECDAAIVQHEYGIYGGPDGDEILAILDRLTVPSIVVLHTVLTTPSVHQRAVLEEVVARADAVVTMTEAAQSRLIAGYRVDARKVHIIAHGATSALTRTTLESRASPRPTVLTWGLIGPGKGIEWGIDAMALLGDLAPAPHYVVAGQTHPKVLAREGERYRDGLQARVAELGLGAAITFDARYRDLDSLTALVRSADVVLLPYDSTDQVTSGVLIEAIAAGKPVVATAFPHARELLGDGAGLVVAHRDPSAIADALRAVLTRRDLALRMAALASARAPQLLWPAVAAQYRTLASDVISAGLAA